MLAEDNASGTVTEDGRVDTILHFPGVRGRTANLPPVSETGAVQGVGWGLYEQIVFDARHQDGITASLDK